MVQYVETQAAPAGLPGVTALLAPLYMYPNPATAWDTINGTAPPVRYVVANPSSGPGSTADSYFTAAIQAARAAGITVLGYVDTHYNAVSLATVNSNIALWQSLYGVNSIFFDRADTTTASLDYYSQACGYVHAVPGAIAVLNHGTIPEEHYAALGDVLVVFENQYSSWSSFTPASWFTSYPPPKLAVLVWNVPSGDMVSVLSQVQSYGIGNVYITDEADDNFSSLPSYLTAEAAAALSLGAGLDTTGLAQTITGQKTFTAPGTTPSGRHWYGSVIADDLTIQPNSAISTSASLFLDNGAGQVWEFFCSSGAACGIFDKANSKQPVTVASNISTTLSVVSAGVQVGSGPLDVKTAGQGLQVAEGSNAKQGTATLSSGTVVVSNTSVTVNSRIFLTAQDNNSTGTLRVSARTSGTSFTITSSNASDSGVVAYEIFEPG